MSPNKELSSISAFLLFWDDDRLKSKNFDVIGYTAGFMVFAAILFAKGL